MPPSPNVTASTASSLASIEITTSPPHASATDRAGRAPWAATASTLSWERLYAVTSWPAFSRFTAMPEPMFPSPMNPIFMPSTMPDVPECRQGVRLSGCREVLDDDVPDGQQHRHRGARRRCRRARRRQAAAGRGQRQRLRVPLDRGAHGRQVPAAIQRGAAQGVGHRGGDAIDVELTVDTAPRTVEVPDDLQAALDASPAAAAAWEKLSYSQRKAHVTSVLGAKAAETRARRITKVTATLEG